MNPIKNPIKATSEMVRELQYKLARKKIDRLISKESDPRNMNTPAPAARTSKNLARAARAATYIDDRKAIQVQRGAPAKIPNFREVLERAIDGPQR